MIGRHESGEDLRARCRRAARDVDVVLDGEGDAGERKPFACSDAPIDRFGLAEGRRRVRRKEGSEGFLRLFDAHERLLGDRARCHAPGADGVGESDERSLEKRGRRKFGHRVNPS